MPTLTGDDDDGYDDNVEVVKKNKGKKNKKEVKERRTNQTRDLTCCRIQSRIWAKRNSCRSIEPSMNACPSRPSTSMKKPLRRKKTSAAVKAMRLLPSTKPWFFASDSINAAASSSMEL